MPTPLIRYQAASSRGRWLLALATVLHLTLVALWASGALDGLFFNSSQPGTRRDSLHSFYQAGVNLRAGLSPYIGQAQLDPAVVRAHTLSPFRYMPLIAWVFAGISAAVPLSTLDALWPLVLEALLWLAVWITLRARRFGVRRYLAAAMWLVFTPFLLELHLGQISMVMAVGILLLLLDALGARPLGRGFVARRALDLVWAGTITVKAFTGLLVIPYARARQYGRLLVGLGLVAATSGLLFALRPEELRGYLAVNSGAFLAQVHPGTMGMQALVRSITDPALPAWWRGQRVVLGPLDLMYGNLPCAMVVATVLVIALWVTLRLRREELFRGLALWVAAFFLVYRQVWEYHYLMLLPVVVCVYLASGKRWTMVAWGLMALPTPYALLAGWGIAAESSPVWALYHAMKPAAALLTFGFLVAQPVRLSVPVTRRLPAAPLRPAYAGAEAAWAVAEPAGGHGGRAWLAADEMEPELVSSAVGAFEDVHAARVSTGDGGGAPGPGPRPSR